MTYARSVTLSSCWTCCFDRKDADAAFCRDAAHDVQQPADDERGEPERQFVGKKKSRPAP